MSKSAKKEPKMTPAEQRKRFIETARKLEVDETQEGQERAFGRVGLKKPKKSKRRS